MSEDLKPIRVDARGHNCPIPSLKLRKAVLQTQAGQVIHIVASDPMAKIDIPHLCAEMGWACTPLEGADIGFAVSR
jgi:tRNA 2-thiouridine synthesizing protein A